MSARALQFIMPCTLLVLMAGCSETQSGQKGSIDTWLLSEHPSYEVDWEDIANMVSRKKIEPILNETIEADGARVSAIVDGQLVRDFDGALEEQYEMDGQEYSSGTAQIVFKGHSIKIILGLYSHHSSALQV